MYYVRKYELNQKTVNHNQVLINLNKFKKSIFTKKFCYYFQIIFQISYLILLKFYLSYMTVLLEQNLIKDLSNKINLQLLAGIFLIFNSIYYSIIFLIINLILFFTLYLFLISSENDLDVTVSPSINVLSKALVDIN